MEELQKHDVEIDAKIDSNGKFYLHINEQKFELSYNSTTFLLMKLKKVLKLKREYNLYHKKGEEK